MSAMLMSVSTRSKCTRGRTRIASNPQVASVTSTSPTPSMAAKLGSSRQARRSARVAAESSTMRIFRMINRSYRLEAVV